MAAKKTTTKKAPTKMGRPKKEISQEHFESLCNLQCTETEIAGFFKCSEDTINNWCKETYDGLTFSDVYKKYSQDGKISLRRYQFRLAERNASMAIWLGKQYLGQKDNVTITNTVEEDDEISKSLAALGKQVSRKLREKDNV